MCLSEFEYVCLSENKFVNSVNNVNYGFLVVCGNFNCTFTVFFKCRHHLCFKNFDATGQAPICYG